MMGKQTLILTPNIAEIFKTQDLLDKIGGYIITSPEIKEGKDLISQIKKLDKRRRTLT